MPEGPNPTIAVPAGQLDIKGPQSATGVDRWMQVGSLAFTGLALTCAIVVAMPSGALGYTGRTLTATAVLTTQAINIPAGEIQFKGPQRPGLTIPAGSLVFTGHAPGLGTEMQVGRLAWTGLAPTLDIVTGTTIAVPVGSLAFTGLEQTVRAGDHEIEVPAGSLIFKGPARAEAVPKPTAGVLAFTGRTLQVLVDVPGESVSIPPGEIAFTGLAPDRLATLGINIPAGTLTFSGQYIRIAFKELGCGSLVWQGLAPVVQTQTTTVPIPVGTLRYTGLAPTAHLSVAIPAGTLAFTSIAMSPANTGALPIPAGSLVFTGTQTISLLVWNVPAGTLALTGQLPVVNRGSHPPAGQLAIQGYALTMVAGNRFVPIPAGSLAFSSDAIEVLRAEPAVGAISGRGSFTRRLYGKGSATTALYGRGSL